MGLSWESLMSRNTSSTVSLPFLSTSAFSNRSLIISRSSGLISSSASPEGSCTISMPSRISGICASSWNMYAFHSFHDTMPSLSLSNVSNADPSSDGSILAVQSLPHRRCSLLGSGCARSATFHFDSPSEPSPYRSSLAGSFSCMRNSCLLKPPSPSWSRAKKYALSMTRASSGFPSSSCPSSSSSLKYVGSYLRGTLSSNAAASRSSSAYPGASITGSFIALS
mmetsp:Transcript_12848/g.30586  ORF Transcript_12848/g.30586 Transcript_12848/m.30586 type:complete len:224 (+) Transcript_12848:347-1018(+)